MTVVSIRSALIAAIAGGGAAAFVLAASRFASFATTVALYHVVVFTIFYCLYLNLPDGFAAHFNVPDKTKQWGAGDIAYYTMATHATVGYGDVYAVTTPARVLVTTHMLLVAIQMFGMLVLRK